jgi:hypothetical protein
MLVGLSDHRKRAVAKDLLEQDGIASAPQVAGCKRVSEQMQIDALPNAGNLTKSADDLLDC